METKTMKKTQITLSFVLASFLVVGLAASINAKKVSALSADDAFSMVTDLSTEKVIHTDRQAEYLAYDGEYETIPEANYPDGTKHISDPNPGIPLLHAGTHSTCSDAFYWRLQTLRNPIGQRGRYPTVH